jgi:hypothetical protein
VVPKLLEMLTLKGTIVTVDSARSRDGSSIGAATMFWG